jgi:hypothetical protein
MGGATPAGGVAASNMDQLGDYTILALCQGLTQGNRI